MHIPASYRRPIVNVGEMFGKQPPSDPAAEMGVLGSCLIDPKQVGEVARIISPEAFYDPKHAAIFSAMVQLDAKHQGGDLTQLASLLAAKDSLEDVGGVDYLYEVVQATIVSNHAPYYAQIVADKWALRRLIEASAITMYEAHTESGTKTASEITHAAEERVFAVLDHGARTKPEYIKVPLDRMYDESLSDKRPHPIPSGFIDLDYKLGGGFNAGEMVVLAARPSMGKSALALGIADNIARAGTPVGFFSLEMSMDALASRLLSVRSRVDAQQVRSHSYPKEYAADVLEHYGVLREIPLIIEDTAAMAISALRASVRRMVARHGVRFVVVDYLQLMTAPESARESRQVEVTAISRGIKALAREAGLPIIAVSQLNRQAEMREGHRPRMSDLRESGSLEMDADTVILLHREEYFHAGDEAWLNANPDKIGMAEVIVAKQRSGPTGIVALAWDSKTTAFRNYAKEYQYE